MDDLLEAFFAASEGLQVYVISDALDECAERETLLESLSTIATRKSSNIKILATSRKERDIERALQPLLTGSVCIQDAKIDADIQLFIRNNIAKSSKMRRWPGSVKEEVETALVGGAKGMFRWVKCQLDILRNRTTLRDLQKALNTLPSTLDQTYDRILLGIDKDDWEKAHCALQWLVFSARPLQLQEIAEAVVVESEFVSFSPEDRLFEPHDIINICSSLVSLSDRTSVLRLTHYSVQEYILSERIREGPASFFGVMEASSDAFIAEICLTYVLLFDKPDSLSKTSLQEWPLLDYACKHWFEHAGRLTDDADRRITNRLSEKLLTPEGNFAFFNWLRVFEPDRPWVYFESHKDPKFFAKPLYYATHCGLLDSARSLLIAGADVEAENWEHRTPLHTAASQGHEAVVRLLLEEKADIERADVRGYKALHLAAKYGHVAVVRLLLNSYASVNGRTRDGRTAIHCAAVYGFVAVIRLLLDYSADVGALDAANATPLHSAAFCGHLPSVQLLLERGAIASACDNNKRTPLHE